MNAREFVVLLSGLGLMLSGCAPTFMTRSLRDSLQADDLSKVQFFLNEKVVLRRELKTDERDVTPGHEIKIVKGKRVEEVEFPKGSAGVSVGSTANSNQLFVSFEPGSKDDPDPALPFSLGGRGDSYVLRSGDEITYQGRTFRACVGSFSPDDVVNVLTFQRSGCAGAGYASLTVDLKKTKTFVRERRVVPGRHVGE